MDAQPWIQHLLELGEDLLRSKGEADLAAVLGTPRPPLPEKSREVSTAQALERLWELSNGPEAETVRRLIPFVVANIEDQAAEPWVLRRMEIGSTLHITRDGGAVPFSHIPALIRGTAERSQRLPLERAYSSLCQQLDEALSQEHSARRQTLAHVAGHKDSVAFVSRATDRDLRRLRDDAERFLDATDDVAQVALAWLMRGRVRSMDYRTSDLWFALAGHDLPTAVHDPWRIDEMFKTLGLLDTTVRHAVDAPLCLCIAEKTPDRVHLVSGSSVGVPGARDRLHETAVALFHCNVSEIEPFDVRRLGDRAAPQGYGMLFGHLLADRSFCRQSLKLSGQDAEAVCRFSAAAMVLLARRSAAKTVSRLAWEEGDDAKALYADLQRRACMVEPLPECFLFDTEPLLDVGQRFRAVLFEAAASRALRETFDEDWFRNPQTGDWLRRSFARGCAHSLDDAVSELGTAMTVATAAKRYEEALD